MKAERRDVKGLGVLVVGSFISMGSPVLSSGLRCVGSPRGA
jgi:hypothetical protein